MKRIALFAILALLFSCSSGSGNKNFARLVDIQDVQEMSQLSGAKIPCVSGAPELFSVVGDGAVCDGEKFMFLMEFKKATKAGSSNMTVKFVNSETGEVYGDVEQILFMTSFLGESFCSGESILKYFYVNTLNCPDADAFKKNVDLAIIEVDPNDFRDNPEKDTRASMSVEDWAQYFMDSYYETIKAGDTETYFAIDYEIGEFDGFTAQAQWQRFYIVTELWKFLFPEKWQVIKEFRQKLISDGVMLVDIDVSDPSFEKEEDAD